MTSADLDTPGSSPDSADSVVSAAVVSTPVDAPLSAMLVIPAWRSLSAWCVLLVVFAVGVFLDLWSKEWAFRSVASQPVVLNYEQVANNPSYALPWHPGVTAIAPDLLDFHLVLNHGAVFGIGQGRGPLFIAFTVLAVCTALWVFGKHTSSRSHLSHIGLALVVMSGSRGSSTLQTRN
jgi:lipoprotein signal peptidase